jgi:hypothetical protein
MTSAEYVMANGIQTVRCKKHKTETASIIGSTGANAGFDEGFIVFEECVVEGNGTACEPTGGKIVSNALKDTLAFSNKTSVKGEPLLQMIAPTKGSVLAKLKFEGAGCTVTETLVEGSALGEVLVSSKESLKLEEDESEGPADFPQLSTTLVKTAWIEEEGVRRE